MGSPEGAAAPDCEVVNARLVQAPRAQVWQAYSDPERLARWWGPKGFSTTSEVCTVRPGGAWRFVMHGPDGTDYPNHMLFTEVAAQERIVLEHLSPPRFRLSMSLAQHGEATRVVHCQRFPSPEACAPIARFAYPSNEEMFDRLEAELGLRR